MSNTIDIELCTDPLVGLQYIVEYKVNDEPVFWCNLCEMTSSNVPLLIKHVTDTSHRMNYIKESHPVYLKKIQGGTLRPELLQEYCKIIEEGEGRQVIERVNNRDLSTFMEYSGQKDTKTDAANVANNSLSPEDISKAPDGRTPFEDVSITELIHKIAMRSGQRNVGDMMKNLVIDLVTNEEEAAKALEAANYMTKAVVNYRLSGSPRS